MNVTIQKDGTLKLPPEALEELGSGSVRVVVDEGKVTLEPRFRRLGRIGDPDERMRAYERFKQQVTFATPVSWPETYDPRDDVYE